MASDNSVIGIASGILAGMYANSKCNELWSTDEQMVEDALDAAERLLLRANDRIAVKKEKERSDRHEYGEYTNICDRNGRSIRNGDIFVYLKYSDLKEIPIDFLEKYADKYSDKVELHPVFWSDELKSWASDVYRDEDYLSSYDTNQIAVVTDVLKHPELYNH